MDTRRGKERRRGRDAFRAGGAGARSLLLAALADRARQTTRGDGVLVEAMEARAQGSLEEARAQCRATASRKSLAQLERRRLESLVDRQSMPS